MAENLSRSTGELSFRVRRMPGHNRNTGGTGHAGSPVAWPGQRFRTAVQMKSRYCLASQAWFQFGIGVRQSSP